MLPRLRGLDVTAVTAQITLVVAPLLAFQAFPTRGGFSIAMALPAAVLAASYFTVPGRRIPVWESALAALLMLSVVWGDEPAYSTGRLRGFVPVLIAAILSANVLAPRVALRCLKIATAVMIVSAVCYIAVSPSARSATGYSGVVLRGQFAKNSFAGLLVLALILAVCTRRARFSFLTVPALVLLIALNRSATAWVLAVALVGAVVIFRVIARGAAPVAVSTYVWFALGAGGLTGLFLLDSDSLLLGILGKDPTLSSRTAIWAACWPEIKNAPILGHGAFTFLDNDSLSPVTLRIWSHFSDTYLPPHPHNGLLDLWGQLGLVGVVVFGCLVFRAIRDGIDGAHQGSQSAVTALACITFVVLFGTTEVTYLGPWLVVTVICAAAARPELRAGDTKTIPARGVQLRVDDPAVGGRHRSAPLSDRLGVR